MSGLRALNKMFRHNWQNAEKSRQQVTMDVVFFTGRRSCFIAERRS